RSLPVVHVVARERDPADLLAELELEHDQPVIAERSLEARQIELPHAQEALVEQAQHLAAMGEEALAPVPQGFGIVQPQDLDIGKNEARALDDRRELGKRRRVAAREDVAPY